MTAIESIKDDLTRGRFACAFECRSLLLGALVQEISLAGFPLPELPESYRGFSLANTWALIRKFRSPVPFVIAQETCENEDDCKDPQRGVVWEIEHEPTAYDPFRSRSRKYKKRGAGLYCPWQETPKDEYPKTLLRHHCSLQTLIEPCLQKIESKVMGLDLSDFHRAN